MKKIKNLLIIFAILFCSVCESQTHSAEIIYQYKKSIDWDNASGIDITEEMKKEVTNSLRKQFEKTFVLNIVNKKSSYKEEETLSRPNMNSFINMDSGIKSGVLFKDLSKREIIEQRDFLGKKFIIKDSIPIFKWRITNESKYIGRFQVFKAVTNKVVTKADFDLWKKNDSLSKRNRNTNPFESFEIPKTIKIEAWYAPEITFQNGPNEFGGLPGLILEVNYGEISIVSSKVSLYKIQPDLKPPKKGKIVTRSEYNEIVTIKMEELKNLFRQ